VCTNLFRCVVHVGVMSCACVSDGVVWIRCWPFELVCDQYSLGRLNDYITIGPEGLPRGCVGVDVNSILDDECEICCANMIHYVTYLRNKMHPPTIYLRSHPMG